jgi:hypothetical protein
MTREKARKLWNGLAIAGIAVLLVGLICGYCVAEYVGIALCVIGDALLIFVLVLNRRYNRCPHCGMWLSTNEKAYCQYCGKQVEDEDTVE